MMINLRKSEVPVMAIAAIVITIIGIALVLTLTNFKLANDFYCKTYYALGININYEKSSFCSERVNIGLSNLSKESVEEVKFSTRTKSILLELPEKNKVSFYLPKNAMIENATFLLSAYEHTQKNFSDGNTSFLFNNNKNFSVKFKLPANAHVTSASIGLMSPIMPDRLEMIFIFDMSNSTATVFSQTCNLVSYLYKNLSYLKFNFTIYELESKRECGEESGINDKIKVIWRRDLNVIGGNYNFSCNTGGKSLCQDQDLSCLCSKVCLPSDVCDEAWGVGGLYINERYNFTENSKRMLLTFSDADPTGTYLVKYGAYYCLNGASPFNGSEDAVVNALINKSVNNNLMIFPVVMPFVESEGLATDSMNDSFPYCKTNNVEYKKGEQCCAAASSNTITYYPYNSSSACIKQMSWLQNIANSTKGQILLYRNQSFEQYADMIQEIIKSKVLQNITINVSSNQLKGPDTLPNETVYDYSTNEFAAAINNALADCTPDSEGMCEIEVIIKAENMGNLNVSNLRITYYDKITSINLSNYNIGDIDDKETSYKIDFKEMLVKSLKECDKSMCLIDYYVIGEGKGSLYLSNLSINYTIYDYMKNLVEKILLCWEKAGYGRYSESHVCESFTIPQTAFFNGLNESLVTDYLINNKRCSLISNNLLDKKNITYGCGRSNDLFVEDILPTTRHILIEYDGKNHQVRVS